MRIIDRLNSNTYQSLRMRAENGEVIELAFSYSPTREQWICAVQYQNIRIAGLAVVNSLNLLVQYKNILPFGLFVNTIDGQDPYFIDDFSNRRAIAALLDSEEVNAFYDYLR